MISDRIIGADSDVSAVALMLDLDGVMSVVAHRMARDMVARAKDSGVKIDPSDVFAWVHPETKEDAASRRRRVSAVWAPDPMKTGCEFYGGSHDGEIIYLPRATGHGNAFPVATIIVASETPTDFEGFRRAEIPPLPAGIEPERYERAGINDTTRRFVYRLSGTK
jgi:hypothetical protein